MTRRKPFAILVSAALMALAAVGIAACGGGGATAATHNTTTTISTPVTASPKAPQPSVTPAKPTRVRTVDVAASELGNVLVDSQGRTLYLFQADVGDKSACSGACAAAWPPLLAHSKPTVGNSVNARLIGTTKRSDGTQQVTYNGHPLYLYIQDQKPGDVTGQGVVAFGAPWYVVSPAGKQVTGR
jgi:predicted lipoprotein with Yx(FWY)xxD motif